MQFHSYRLYLNPHHNHHLNISLFLHNHLTPRLWINETGNTLLFHYHSHLHLLGNYCYYYCHFECNNCFDMFRHTIYNIKILINIHYKLMLVEVLSHFELLSIHWLVDIVHRMLLYNKVNNHLLSSNSIILWLILFLIQIHTDPHIWVHYLHHMRFDYYELHIFTYLYLPSKMDIPAPLTSQKGVLPDVLKD